MELPGFVIWDGIPAFPYIALPMPCASSHLPGLSASHSGPCICLWPLACHQSLIIWLVCFSCLILSLLNELEISESEVRWPVHENPSGTTFQTRRQVPTALVLSITCFIRKNAIFLTCFTAITVVPPYLWILHPHSNTKN